MSNISSDQVQMLQTLLDALNAIKGSVGVADNNKTASKKTKKVKDPNAPKRALNPKIVALNEQRMVLYQEMKDTYFVQNPAAAGKTPEEVRKLAKEGKLPPFPTYPQALKELSRRMSEADPEHAKKAKAYRDSVDKKQAEKKKNSSKNSDTSSVVSGSAEELSAEEVVTEVVTADSPPAPAPAPVPAPAPAPAAEEKKAVRGRPKKMKTVAESGPKVTVRHPSDDPEFFNMDLEADGKVYQLNGLNWVLTKDDEPTWVGLWVPEKKVIDFNAPEPDGDDD